MEISKASLMPYVPSGIDNSSLRNVTIAGFDHPDYDLRFYGSQKQNILFGFLICRFWAHTIEIIPETRRAHKIWYLRFIMEEIYKEELNVNYGIGVQVITTL